MDTNKTRHDRKGAPLCDWPTFSARGAYIIRSLPLYSSLPLVRDVLHVGNGDMLPAKVRERRSLKNFIIIISAVIPFYRGIECARCENVLVIARSKMIEMGISETLFSRIDPIFADGSSSVFQFSPCFSFISS